MGRRVAGDWVLPLLGKAEKAQLEDLILEKLTEYYERQGGQALLAEGVRVVVHGEGVQIDSGEMADPLASVAVRSLFTALCYLEAPKPALPRDALRALAGEAMAATAAQINRIGAS